MDCFEDVNRAVVGTVQPGDPSWTQAENMSNTDTRVALNALSILLWLWQPCSASARLGQGRLLMLIESHGLGWNCTHVGAVTSEGYELSTYNHEEGAMRCDLRRHWHDTAPEAATPCASAAAKESGSEQVCISYTTGTCLNP